MLGNEKTKNIFNFFFRIFISVFCLWFVLGKIDKEQTLAILKMADLSFIFYAGLVFFFVNLLLLWRWFIFVRGLKLEVSFFDVARFFFAGLFGNLFLPSSIGGDVIKIVGLCKNSSQKARVVASVILDRLSGFAGMILVALGAFLLGYSLIEDKSILFFILVLGCLSFGFAVILFNEKIYSFGCRIFHKFPRIQRGLMNVHYDVVLLNHNRRAGFQAVGLACLGQIVFAFTFYLTAKGLHQEIAVIYFLIFVPLICVASVFPSIGGLGVREAGAVYLFTKVGVDSGIAVSLSLINYFFMVMIGLLGGVIYVLTLSSRRIQHHPSDSRRDSHKA